MKRVLFIVLLAGCTLDPSGFLDRAALTVKAFDLPDGGVLTITTTDSLEKTRTKKTKVLKPTMEILYEEGSLADGGVAISAELHDALNLLVGCGTARGVTGQPDPVVLGFASPSVSAINCGTCGHRCETDVATGACISGICVNWECAPGLIDPQSDGGCSEPVIVVPDAGIDGGVDAGVDAGVLDAGMVCVPTGAEDSDTTCSDGADNNCDLRVDCNDPGCAGLTRACTVASCGRPGSQTWNCQTRMWSTCLADQATEATTVTCKDGIDNDCDGMTDCADPRCNEISMTCGIDVCAAGIKLWNCQLGLFDLLCLPYVPVPENSGLLCGNSADDDCDGKTDCADMSCRGRACGGGRVCCADGGCATGC